MNSKYLKFFVFCLCSFGILISISNVSAGPCPFGCSTVSKCGTASGKIYLYTDTSYGYDTICDVGDPDNSNLPFPSPGGSIYWRCIWSSFDSVSCSTSRYGSPPQNGQCGTAKGKTYPYSGE